jgi:hypothetical protein
MIICPAEFEQPDPKNPPYSMTEVDYYAWIPGYLATKEVPNHRLSLRKNLNTGEFELYRRFFNRFLISRKSLTMESGADTYKETVAFKSKDFQEIIRLGNKEYSKYHGAKEKPDQVCQHRPPIKTTFCPVWDKLSIDEKTKIIVKSRKRLKG